jgi:polyhydroxybutyrate depolymerase
LRPALPPTLIAALLTWGATAHAGDSTISYGGREIIVYTPAHLPASGTRALVVVLHGGLGNAARIAGRQSESGLNMDAVADRDGFIVAYLNGTPVTRFMGDRMLGWNAGGGCCGLSAQNDIDDVRYIQGAVGDLIGRYGIERDRVFAIGHSNGAMMAQRLACESTLLSAAVAISGPLNLDIARCPDAAGRRILAIHGADDANVPIQGGRGSKGYSGVAFKSESYAKQVFTASGGSYTLQVVPGADHMLDHIDAAILSAEKESIAEKAARFFGLSPAP